MNQIFVHDGYVRVSDGCVLGSDLMIVNTARVSYDKESKEWSDRDEKLLRYLWANKHTSPFRHASIRFEISAPIFVLRQWMKHQVGCSWNEISARYVDMGESEAFRPVLWRLQDSKNRQSSLGILPRDEQMKATSLLEEAYEVAYKNYAQLIDMGVCREQARVMLPVGMYSKAIWTASLQAVMNFIELRLDDHAQKEMRDFAQAVIDLARIYFPRSMELVRCQDALSVGLDSKG